MSAKIIKVMDNLNDWLYIILLIIGGISSLISSQKKKKRPTEILGQPNVDIDTSGQPQREKGFWEILEETKKELTREEKPQPSPKKKKQNKKVSAPNPFLAAENEMQRSDMVSSIPAGPAFLEEEENTVMTDIEIKDVTDLRKAVIYAEILNRKY